MKTVSKLVLSGVCLAILYGCEENLDPVKTIEERRADSVRETNERHQRMIDNAMLADLSMSDIHFVSSTTHLNELGEIRLQRYAELLEERGGTLYVRSGSYDEDFNKARSASVMAFLASEGILANRIAVASGPRQGTGMTAVEAIEVKLKEYDPDHEDLTDLISGGTGGEFGVGE